MTLKIEATDHTPSISFNKIENVLYIEGRSLPENPVEFYRPVQLFVESLTKQLDTLVIDVRLDFFNTSSSKQLFELFRKLKPMVDTGKVAKVIWRYDEDDEDLLEAGEDYMEMSEVPFELVSE